MGEDGRRGGGGGSSGELGADGVKVGGGRSKDQRGEKWEKKGELSQQNLTGLKGGSQEKGAVLTPSR